VAEQTANKLRQAVAHSGTEPRDLAEYDALPRRGVATPSPGSDLARVMASGHGDSIVVDAHA
jgi:hypothetical protein